MKFSERPPSTCWEQVPLSPLAGSLWCWFSPVGNLHEVLVQIPPETFQQLGMSPSLQQVLQALGISEEELEAWVVNGSFIPSQAQTLPWLQQPLPILQSPLLIRVRGSSPGVFAAAASPRSVPQPARESASGNLEQLYQQIEGDWLAVEQIEGNMQQLRKQLNALAGRLKSLNRDLSTDEFQAADSQDKRDWQDIRRWLRDAAAGVSRSMREFDVGDLSAAGGRGRFEELYRTVLVPRAGGANLQGIAAEFELYRKLCQNQFQKMQAAVSAAARDGEQRAAQFLTRIAAKVRQKRGQRG